MSYIKGVINEKLFKDYFFCIFQHNNLKKSLQMIKLSIVAYQELK